MIAHALSRLRWLVGPPDSREPNEIESDLTDEFEFHLRMLQREEEAAGASPEAARVAAQRRFGDVDRVRRACRAIALQERTLMQRLNAVLTIVLLLAVIGIGTQVVFGLRKTTSALDTISARLESLGERPNGALVPIDGRADSSAGDDDASGGTPSADRTEEARRRPTRPPLALANQTESNFDRTRYAWLSGDVVPRAIDVQRAVNRRVDRVLASVVASPLPEIYRTTAEVTATILRPRGDGADETVEASWTGWITQNQFWTHRDSMSGREHLPAIAPADRIELRFTLASPLPTLPEDWTVTASIDELRGALAVLGATIRAAVDGSVEVDPETLERYRAEEESVRLRLAAMGLDAEGQRSE